MLAVAMTSGAPSFQCGQLVGLELGCQLGLQDRVGARRAAAKMRIGDRSQFQSDRLEDFLDVADQALAVLQRAGRMERHALRPVVHRHLRREPFPFGGDHFDRIPRQRCDAARLVGVRRIVAQQMTVRLDDDAASAGADDDRLDALLDMRPPGVDVGAREIERLVVRAEVIAQCAAAAGARSADQRDVDPVERAGERGIDTGRQRRLHATGERQHPPAVPRVGPAFGGPRRGNLGGKRARQQRPRDAAGRERQRKQPAMGESFPQQPAAQPLAGRTLDSLLGDTVPDIEQPPEADTGRTSRFATAAAETAVEVQRGRGGDLRRLRASA